MRPNRTHMLNGVRLCEEVGRNHEPLKSFNWIGNIFDLWKCINIFGLELKFGLEYIYIFLFSPEKGGALGEKCMLPSLRQWPGCSGPSAGNQLYKYRIQIHKANTNTCSGGTVTVGWGGARGFTCSWDMYDFQDNCKKQTKQIQTEIQVMTQPGRQTVRERVSLYQDFPAPNHIL